jgi:large subunit ribosomal protein L13
MKTYAPKPQHVQRRWYVVDADGAVLGRLASEVAKILRGKHKPIFAPHADTGDHVVIVNARRVRLTGGKEERKVAYRHSGYPGGLRETLYSRLLATRPAFVVERAVRGMLPKNRLGRAMLRKLNVYEGPDHPHRAQSPIPLKLGETPAWGGLPAPPPPPTPRPAPATRTGRKGAPETTPARRPAAKRAASKRQAATGETRTTRAPKTAARSTAKSRAQTTATSGAKATTTKTGASKSSADRSRTRTRRTKAEDEEG